MQASIRMVGNLTHQPSDRTTIRSGGPLDSSARERERDHGLHLGERGHRKDAEAILEGKLGSLRQVQARKHLREATRVRNSLFLFAPTNEGVSFVTTTAVQITSAMRLLQASSVPRAP